MRDFPLWLRGMTCLWLSGHIGLTCLGADTLDHRNQVTLTEPSAESVTALKRFRVAPGLKAEVFASEPLLANPVSFAFDEKGRVYVVETNRRRTSVFDIRGHQVWLDDDLSFRTVQDRIDFLKEQVQPANTSFIQRTVKPGGFGDLNKDGVVDYRDLEVESEGIRLLTDKDGDGRADHATVYADKFNSIVSGVAAGVLARRGEVWFACIPDVWRLRDDNDDGAADTRQSIASGFGVHIAFGGHDLHGLKFGPDGKLYFSIADRGSHVETSTGTFAYPDTGAIFRCNPDGSKFEVFAYGLRNPQELAFDDYGNLWTGDNNGDGGDAARWVYVVEGSDNGWHIGWQWLPKMGPWNAERLWHLPPNNTATYLVPPIAHIGHGPAGIAYYPGTGLPAQYNHHFFYADFPGGIRTFTVQPQGAGFIVSNPENYLQDNSADKVEGKLLWGLSPVDVDFGPDGGAYVADWIEGWEKTGKGRIFRVYDPEVAKSPAVQQTKRLLASDWTKKSVRELAALLENPDQRVRLEAQYELAARGSKAIKTLHPIAARGKKQLARLHAIWALGQISQQQPKEFHNALKPLIKLLADSDAEVRAQAAHTLGDRRYVAAGDALVKLLADASLRVRFFAAQSLGKLKHATAAPHLLALLRENADRDAHLRHAAVMGLIGTADEKTLLATASDSSDSVRLGVLLALRRLAHPEIARFLNDAHPQLVLEAARAINDVPIVSAQPALAAWLSQNKSLALAPELQAAVTRRAINATFRQGLESGAQALVQLATRATEQETMRVEALQALGDWENPSGRDRVIGLWRPLPPRGLDPVRASVGESILQLVHQAPPAVSVAAIQTANRWDVTGLETVLLERLREKETAPEVITESLRTLAARKNARLPEALELLAQHASEIVRKEVSRQRALSGNSDNLSIISEILEKGSLSEKQNAFTALANNSSDAANKLLSGWLEKLAKDQIDPALRLDVMEVAQNRPALKPLLDKLTANRAADDALAPYRDTLHGGDAAAGRTLFMERAELGCFRCHKANGEGGEVGPELAGIATKKGREYLLESILFPNQQIATGYENVIVTLKSGIAYFGVVKSETATELVLNSPEDGEVKIPKAEITARERGLSSMPEELGNQLSPRELRNLIEFIATLK